MTRQSLFNYYLRFYNVTKALIVSGHRSPQTFYETATIKKIEDDRATVARSYSSTRERDDR